MPGSRDWSVEWEHQSPWILRNDSVELGTGLEPERPVSCSSTQQHVIIRSMDTHTHTHTKTKTKLYNKETYLITLLYASIGKK